MEVNASAPAIGRDSIEVAASPEVVWRVLTDIPRWPTWNPDVKSASMEGPLAPGSKFRWKAGPGTITSTLEEIGPSHLICWTGTTLGIKAVHVHRLEQQGSSTVVTSEESWESPLVRLMQGSMQKKLQQSIETGLRALKTEAEGIPA